MKRIYLLFALSLLTIGAIAQNNQYFWYNGNMMYGSQIIQTDSITFGDEPKMDTLHLLLPRLTEGIIRVTVHDTIEKTVYKEVCNGMGELKGWFSVAPDKKVRFSPGNLQYQPSTDTWRFAENQWDYVGNHADGTVYNNGVKCDNRFITKTGYDGWIDLFGWGTGQNPTNTGTATDDYAIFNEWGGKKKGGIENNTWRTLTKDEWEYLLDKRDNAELLFGFAVVNGVNGLIILPDNRNSSDFPTFEPGNNPFATNTYSAGEWFVLQEKGAVFLPTTGLRYVDGISSMKQTGYYWSKSNNPADPDIAYTLFLMTNKHEQIELKRYYGCSVRLVQDL